MPYPTGPAGHCKHLSFDFERDGAGDGGARMSQGEQGGGHCSHPGERCCWPDSRVWEAEKCWTTAIFEGRMNELAVDATEAEDTG